MSTWSVSGADVMDQCVPAIGAKTDEEIVVMIMSEYGIEDMLASLLPFE